MSTAQPCIISPLISSYSGSKRKLHIKGIIDPKAQRLKQRWKTTRSLRTQDQPQRLTPTRGGPINHSLSLSLALFPVHQMKRSGPPAVPGSSKVSQGDLFSLLFVHCVLRIYHQRVTDQIFRFKHVL